MHPFLQRSLRTCAAFALAMLSLLPALAAAANLNWTDDTSVALSVPAVTMTIAAGSSATNLVVNAGDITVTVPLGQQFTVRSGDRQLLTSGGSGNKSCVSGISTVVINGAQTVTVTPASIPCSGGGGGEGGGGGQAPAPSPSPVVSRQHPNGTLVLEGTTVYLIRDGGRTGFRSEQEYLSHGFAFSQVVPSSAADNARPFNSIQKALEGTLVIDSSDNRTVYMVGVNGTKRGFVSATVFNTLGYRFGGLPSINLTDYPSGAPVADAASSHPEGALVLDGTTVWWIRGGTRQGFESEAVFKTYGFTFARVVKANASDLALPVGSLVKFRDGTLVKDGSAYFIVSDGKKLAFASPEALTVWGYRLSNVISASLSAYERHPSQPLQ